MIIRKKKNNLPGAFFLPSFFLLPFQIKRGQAGMPLQRDDSFLSVGAGC
jgi:hypothetical protein